MNDLRQFTPHVRAKIGALRREHKEACDRVARTMGCSRFSDMSAGQIGRIPAQVMHDLGQTIDPIVAQLQELLGSSPAASASAFPAAPAAASQSPVVSEPQT